MMDFQECLTKEDYQRAFTVVRELRPHLDEQGYLELMGEMQEYGSRAFLGCVDDQPVCYAGVRVGCNLYEYKNVYVDDLVTISTGRSKGYGLSMLQFIEQWGIEQQCKMITLSSGLQRTDAHRFYLDKAGYDKVSFVFRKSLEVTD